MRRDQDVISFPNAKLASGHKKLIRSYISAKKVRFVPRFSEAVGANHDDMLLPPLNGQPAAWGGPYPPESRPLLRNRVRTGAAPRRTLGSGRLPMVCDDLGNGLTSFFYG